MSDDKHDSTPKRTQDKTKQNKKNHAAGTAPKFNSVIPPKGKEKKTDPKGIGRSSAILLALLSTLAGGALGIGGTILMDGTSGSSDARAQLQTLSQDNAAHVQELMQSIQSQNTNLKKLQAAIKANTSNLGTLDTNEHALLKRQDEMSEVLTILTEASQQENASDAIKQLKARLDILDAALSDGEQSTDGTNAILERFTALEDKHIQLGTALEIQEQANAELESLVKTLSAPASFPKPSTETIKIPKGNTAQERADTLHILINTFPRSVMLAAVAKQESLEAKRQNWLKRTLSKHIKVRDEAGPSPRVIIDTAEIMLKAGKINEAIQKISKLNPPVRAVAAEWVKAAQKAVKSNPNTDQ